MTPRTIHSRPEYWSGQPFPSPADLPNPGIEPRSLSLQADSLPAEPQGKPKLDISQSFQSFSHARLFVIPWTAAPETSLSITNSWSLLKLMSIESMMSSNRLILCHPLLLLPSIFPSIRVFSNESVIHNRWPKYWSFGINASK